MQITESRWKLLGHILQQHPETITNTVMYQYFDNESNDKIKTTKLPNSLPVQLHRDLQSIKQKPQPKNSKDLQH